MRGFLWFVGDGFCDFVRLCCLSYNLQNGLKQGVGFVITLAKFVPKPLFLGIFQASFVILC